MTAVRYDSNFSVQLVERAREPQHHEDGDVACCAHCQTPVIVVCPKGHDAPIAYLTKTNGAHLRPAKTRSCACGRQIEVKNARHCETCRSKDRATHPRPGICNVTGCGDEVASYTGRGRPPKKCRKHWNPVAKRRGVR